MNDNDHPFVRKDHQLTQEEIDFIHSLDDPQMLVNITWKALQFVRSQRWNIPVNDDY